jgi:hypothetical protein
VIDELCPVAARCIEAGSPMTLFGDHLNQEPFWVACECRKTPCIATLPEDWEAKGRRFECLPRYKTPEFLAKARKVWSNHVLLHRPSRPSLHRLAEWRYPLAWHRALILSVVVGQIWERDCRGEDHELFNAWLTEGVEAYDGEVGKGPPEDRPDASQPIRRYRFSYPDSVSRLPDLEAPSAPASGLEEKAGQAGASASASAAAADTSTTTFKAEAPTAAAVLDEVTKGVAAVALAGGVPSSEGAAMAGAGSDDWIDLD